MRFLKTSVWVALFGAISLAFLGPCKSKEHWKRKKSAAEEGPSRTSFFKGQLESRSSRTAMSTRKKRRPESRAPTT